MQVKDCMTSPVVTVSPTDTVHDAMGTMLAEHVGSVVVMDGEPVGILTRSDVLRDIYRNGADVAETRVQDIMSTELVTISPCDSVDKALHEMELHGIKKLPVVGQGLVGIVTLADIGRNRSERVIKVQNARTD
ncbi:CBS domain-containing protein [Natranaeroarchaeum sulfidigenes]|uniref:CBS domain n=1 Tax=Natranaeroarchaeum sulfidigenes TaxID=2784880 RepID=A0A897MT66_9EURY|nr:CBS domain-containing protein [Natranaeroarchaeum sulfidigenes]QSG03228.1 CBS domain [Natranaeroarchaeum sulfidigenes]